MHAEITEDNNAVRDQRLISRFYFSEMQSLKLYLEILTL